MGKDRLISLVANISGEMKVEDIPIAGWANTVGPAPAGMIPKIRA